MPCRHEFFGVSRPLARNPVRGILNLMTLSDRHTLLNVLLAPAFAALTLVILAWIGRSRGAYPVSPDLPRETAVWWNIQRTGSIPDLIWAMAGISFLTAFPLAAEMVFRRRFGRSPSPEMFFLRLFLLTLPLQAVRLLIPAFSGGPMSIFLAGGATRLAWFARLLGLAALMNVGLYTGDIPFRRSGAILGTSALAVMALSVMIPLDNTQELGNLLIRSGADNSLALICIAMEILSVLTLVGSAVSLGKNRYHLLAVMLLLVIAGTDMAFFAARPLVIPGAALLTAGVIGFAREIRKIYLWV